MFANRHLAPLARLVLPVFGALISLHCGSSTPTGPGTSATVSAITFGTTTVAAGSALQGTVTLAGAAPASGVTVSLTSSNPAVATVQTPVTVPAGASSAAISVTGLTVGTATITASLNGTSRQSPPLTVGPAIAVASITLNVPTVVGGDTINGTVTLTAAVPQSGAVVSLSGTDPVIVASTVTVLAGATSAPFALLTRVVSSTIVATVTASLGGVSKTATLSVTRPTVATASFGVTGPTETETCTLANSGTTLNCTFNGSTSTAPGTIVAWDWSYTVGSTLTQTTSGPMLTMPAVSCAWLPPPPLPAGASALTLVVKLIVHDDLGNASEAAVHSGARLIPRGACGY